MMKKLIWLLLMLCALRVYAADVVLGVATNMSWAGSGNDFYAVWGGAAGDPNPADPWAGTYAGLWKMFETNSAGAFIDYSGNAGTGIITGVVVSDGKYTNQYGQLGSGNLFDGSDDCATIADKDVLSLTTNGIDNKFTIVAQWSLKTKNASTYDCILSKDNYTTDNNEEYWAIYEGSFPSLWLYDKASASRNKYVKFKVKASAWATLSNRLVIVIAYGGQTNCNIYGNISDLNAVSATTMYAQNVGTTVVSYVCMTNRAATLKIGRLGGSTLYSLNGEIHDAAIIPGTNWTLAKSQTWLEKTIWTNHLYKMTQ